MASCSHSVVTWSMLISFQCCTSLQGYATSVSTWSDTNLRGFSATPQSSKYARWDDDSIQTHLLKHACYSSADLDSNEVNQTWRLLFLFILNEKSVFFLLTLLLCINVTHFCMSLMPSCIMHWQACNAPSILCLFLWSNFSMSEASGCRFRKKESQQNGLRNNIFRDRKGTMIARQSACQSFVLDPYPCLAAEGSGNESGYEAPAEPEATWAHETLSRQPVLLSTYANKDLKSLLLQAIEVGILAFTLSFIPSFSPFSIHLSLEPACSDKH